MNTLQKHNETKILGQRQLVSYNQDVIFVVSQPMNFSKSRKEVFSFSVEKINA